MTEPACRGFGSPQPPPTLEEYVEREKAKGKRSRDKKRYQEMKKAVKSMESVHNIVGAESEGRQSSQKKQAW